MSDQLPPIQLRADLAVDAARMVFEEVGRVHLRPVLEDRCAAALLQAMTDVPWQLHFNQGAKSYDAAAEQVSALPDKSRVLLLDAIHSQAAQDFQYLYFNLPISDIHAAGKMTDSYLMRLFEFLNGELFLDAMRRVTGDASIVRADAQATLYRAGHFLTQHDDQDDVGTRAVAYVLNLSPSWRADWGGILNFLDADGHVSEGFIPTFNALNVFKVPQPHNVSYVTPFAGEGRFSITGWLHRADS